MEEELPETYEDLSGTGSSMDIPPGSDSSSKRSKKRKHKHSKDKLQKKTRNIFPAAAAAADGFGGEVGVPIGSSLSFALAAGPSVVPPAGADQPRSKKSKKKEKYKEKSSARLSKKEKKNLKRQEAEELGELKVDAVEVRAEKKKTGRDDDDTDSEEERWLTAIETGKLDEVDDELKRFRNPRLLTARQRALLGKQRPAADGEELIITVDQSVCYDGPAPNEAVLRPQDIPPEPLLALPSGFKEKVVTQEMLEKRAIKSERRKAQALVKREEDKRKTVDRLLKKQDPKLLKAAFPKKVAKSEVTMFSYRSNKAGVFISLPGHCSYPLTAAKASPKPGVQQCGVESCTNVKTYRCSKTGVPLCSLRCYKANILAATAVRVT